MPEVKETRDKNKNATTDRAKKKQSRRNVVRATTRTLELTRVGHAVNFKVLQKGRLLGRLEVGLGVVRWTPPGKRREDTKTIPWKIFATMIQEWPFGESVASRLKFQDGYLRWRSPGKKGVGRKMSWEEFVKRMEAPLSKAATKAIATRKTQKAKE